jgi:hypothetical protein
LTAYQCGLGMHSEFELRIHRGFVQVLPMSRSLFICKPY